MVTISLERTFFCFSRQLAYVLILYDYPIKEEDMLDPLIIERQTTNIGIYAAILYTQTYICKCKHKCHQTAIFTSIHARKIPINLAG